MAALPDPPARPRASSSCGSSRSPCSALFFVAPNNVARTLAGRQATPETVALIKHRLGLDQPIWKQYLRLRRQRAARRPRLRLLPPGAGDHDHRRRRCRSRCRWRSAPPSSGSSSGSSTASSRRCIRGRSPTAALTAFALFFYSMPDVPARPAAALLPLLPAHPGRASDWFPAGGYAPLSAGLGPWVQHLILPWFALALVLAATYTRLTRGSMLDVLGEDYIRTARSKGIRESG